MKKNSALRSLLFFGFIAFSQSLISLSSFGQNFQGVADREIQRRQTAIPQGEAALARGKAAMEAKNFTLAHEEFRTAVTYLPDAVVSGKAHDKAVEGFCKSGVTLAEQRIAEGRYAEAEAILREILSDRYDEEAYNETRGRSLWQVEKGWEEPVHQYGQAVAPFAEAFARDASGTARITTKLNTIIIPRVEFRDASIREAIDFLRQQAVENDPSVEGKKGVDIVLRLAPLGQIAPPPVPVQPAP